MRLIELSENNEEQQDDLQSLEMAHKLRDRSIFHAKNIVITGPKENSKPVAMSGIKTTRINNVLCFVQWNLDVIEKTCTFKVHSKLRPEPAYCKLESVDNFDIEEFLPRLQFFLLPNEEPDEKFDT